MAYYEQILSSNSNYIQYSEESKLELKQIKNSCFSQNNKKYEYLCKVLAQYLYKSQEAKETNKAHSVKACIEIRGHFPSNMNYFPWPSQFCQSQLQEVQGILIQDPFEVLCNIQMALLFAQQNFQSFQPLNFMPEAIFQMPHPPNQQPIFSQENEREESSIKRKEARDIQKQISSSKKNSESNLVNQFLSFFNSRQKSAKIVLKAMEYLKKDAQTSQKILTLFFNVVRMINKSRGRKYVNRTLLNSLLCPSTLFDCVPDLAEKMDKVQFVSKDQVCQLFRRCLRYFLRTTCVNVILTSKRISVISKDEHFRKRRKIFSSVTQN